MRLTARVPATSANLGPGFDCFGLALDLCNEVTIDTDAEPGVTWEGEGARELPTDGGDLVSRALAAVAPRVELDLPPLALHGVNRIPLERGLGSSAAAAVAGLLLGCRLAGTDLSLEELLELAVEIEGHADNVAAALLGGLVNVYRYRGRWRVATASPAPLLRPVVLVPETARLPTSEARDALPADVPLADAAFNAGRAALVWRALTADPELLAEALEDRLHEKVRLALVPPSGELFQTLRDAGVPVCVSGAGPSLLAFESEEHRVPDPGPGWRALRIPVRPVGADVL